MNVFALVCPIVNGMTLALSFLLLALTPQQPLRIRDLARHDILPVAKLLQSSFACKSNPLSAALIIAENAFGLRERMSDNVLLVAVRPIYDVRGACGNQTQIYNEQLVGFVELLTPEWLASDAALGYPDRVRDLKQPFIFSLAIDVDARKTGVGSALMRAVERRAAVSGATCVNLEVEEANKPALDLYRKLGYHEVGRDERGRKLVGDILFGRSERVTKLSLEKRLHQDSVAEEEGQVQLVALSQEPEVQVGRTTRTYKFKS